MSQDADITRCHNQNHTLSDKLAVCASIKHGESQAARTMLYFCIVFCVHACDCIFLKPVIHCTNFYHNKDMLHHIHKSSVKPNGHLKYECIYLHAFETGSAVKAGIGRWIEFYNHRRPHSTHGITTPEEAYTQSMTLQKGHGNVEEIYAMAA